MIAIPRVFTPSCRQRVFRRLLDATARPGTLATLGPELEGAPAWLAVLSVFVDRAVTFADPQGLLDARERAFLPHATAPAERAGWLLLDGRRAPPAEFAPTLGSLEEPERGATIVLRVEALGRGRPLRLEGPGVDGRRLVAVEGLDPGWLAARSAWCAFFPRGVDLVLADRERVLVLPRATRISEP